MKIDIDNLKLNTNAINVISLDGTFFPARNIFVNGHIIICKNDGRKVKCFKDLGLGISQLEEVLLNINSYFAKKGVKGFTLLGDRFLINLDNMQEIHFKSNLLGTHLVEAEFENGQIVEIYKGQSEQYAMDLIQQYIESENNYKEQDYIKE